MKLHEAITKGIEARPLAARGVYFSGNDKSDVLGAAYQGHTGHTEVNNHEVSTSLETWFPVLSKSVDHPETSERMSLKKVLLHLNDELKWKRKNIARFVKAVEDRMAVADNQPTCGSEFPISRD